MKLRNVLQVHKNYYQQTPDTTSLAEAALTASFVVPVYNSALTIAACVQSIVSQQRADLIREVILVDDGSTDSSLNEMRRVAARYPRIKIIVEENGNRKYAAYTRNKGLVKATADLIYFIDSDIILPQDYMYRHIMQHQTDDHCITFSLRSSVPAVDLAMFPINANETDFRYKLLKDNDKLQDTSFNFCDTHTLAELCLTCAVTYRRNDLIMVKGCPENFKGWGFNDTAMAAKVIALGRSIVPIYETTVAHIEHAPRSGTTSAKWSEFAKNKRRYDLMLDLGVEDTFSSYLEALEI